MLFRDEMSRVARIGCVAAMFAALIFAHWGPLAAMVGLWSRSPMYSYAYSVPIISAYLIWMRRSELARYTPRASWRVAIPTLLLGMSMLLAGRLANIQVLQQLAFIVNLTGALLAVFGTGYVRVIWAGLAYLLLMVPIWDGFTEPIHARFQYLSAAIGTMLLRAVGVPAHHEHIRVTLPNVVLEVARSCSGVNYLVAVVALGLPLAYLSLSGIWRRVALVGSAILIAGFSNGLRVALIGALTYLEIGSPLHGPMHVLHGLFVAAVGYVALFVGLRLLSRAERPSTPIPDTNTIAPFVSSQAWTVRAALIATMFCVAGIAPISRTVSAEVLSERLDAFPVELGAWKGDMFPVQVSPADIRWNGADEQLRRVYSNGDGHLVEVYVAYFESQGQGRELANFRAAELHRAASPLTVTLSGDRKLRANFVHLSEDRIALFWYEINGAVETSLVRTQLRTLWNTVTNGRSNGAVIMLSTSSSEDSSAATKLDLREIGALVYDGLARTLPGRSAASPP
jgi:EpsI family protein